MQARQNRLTEEQFREELLKRFFHPDSYFSHCFGYHLKSFLNEGGNSNNNEYLLIGNLMDKLTASENLVQELGSILVLKGFEEFSERLSKGVSYLFESDLKPEKMKIKIEGLAKSMFKGAVNAFQNEESKKELENFLGIQSIPSAPIILPEIEDTNELEESPSEEPVLTEPEFSLEEVEDHDAASENLREKKEFFSSDKSKDAFDTTGFEVTLAEEGDSFDFSQQSSEASESTKVESLDPLPLTEGFDEVIEKQIQDFDGVVKSGNWSECATILENIASSAMIYGFDAVEEIAFQSVKFIAEARKSSADDKLTRSRLSETADVLRKTLTKDPEKINFEEIKRLSQKLNNPRESDLSLKEQVSKETAEPKLEKKKEKGSDSDRNLKLSEFKLPGEDEIVNLISEISDQNEPSVQLEPVSQQEQSSQPEPDVLIADNPNLEPSDEFSNYKQQAALYFSVIDQALEILAGQPGHKTALEDIELACNSLYGLVMKLNLDSLAKLPALMGDLVKNIIANRYSLSSNEHRLLKISLSDFRNLNSVIETERREFKETLVALQSLNSKVKMYDSARPRNIEKFRERHGYLR